MSSVEPKKYSLLKAAGLALTAVAVVMLAGCDAGPSLGHDREQVRVLHAHHANAESRHRVARLGDDEPRAIRILIAKTNVTPTDAAKLPVGSLKTLKSALTNPRFRRYGPAIVRLIGMVGGEAEFRFLQNYLENEVRGSVDEYTYRTLLTVPEALGYIAIHNDRAYATLRGYLRLQFWRENIQWRFMGNDREGNAYRLVLSALDGLAIAGRPGAVEYVQFMVKHQRSAGSGDGARNETLMDTRLEARAQQTIDILRVAQ